MCTMDGGAETGSAGGHSADGAEVRVRPRGLQHSGAHLRRVAYQLAGGLASVWPDLSDPGDNPGWGVTEAAVGSAAGWRDLLRDLTADLDDLGMRYVAAADAYVSADARAASRTAPAVPS